MLSSEGSLAFLTDRASISQGGFLFQVSGFDFDFCLSFQNEAIVFQRNNTFSVLNLAEFLKESDTITVFAMWSHSELKLDCRAKGEVRQANVPTQPTAPPARLVKWARRNSLLPIETYKSEEEFRERIHSSLNTINQKIREADAFKSFWNIRYDGQKIVERKPKREVEVQPIIHCILSDQMLVGNIEVIESRKPEKGIWIFFSWARLMDKVFVSFVQSLNWRIQRIWIMVYGSSFQDTWMFLMRLMERIASLIISVTGLFYLPLKKGRL